MDLSKLDLNQLLELQKMIPQAIKARQAQEKSQLLSKVKAMAQQHGFSLEELLGALLHKSGTQLA